MGTVMMGHHSYAEMLCKWRNKPYATICFDKHPNSAPAQYLAPLPAVICVKLAVSLLSCRFLML